MYWNPYVLLSREEQLKKIWEEQLTPDLQAAGLRMAADKGMTLMELLWAIGEDHDARMADPVRRKELLDISEEIHRQSALPFGPDPRLAMEEELDEDEDEEE